MTITTANVYIKLLALIVRDDGAISIMRNLHDRNFYLSVYVAEEGATFNLYEERHVNDFIAKHWTSKF
jgi:hypothetical protein